MDDTPLWPAFVFLAAVLAVIVMFVVTVVGFVKGPPECPPGYELVNGAYVEPFCVDEDVITEVLK